MRRVEASGRGAGSCLGLRRRESAGSHDYRPPGVHPVPDPRAPDRDFGADQALRHGAGCRPPRLRGRTGAGHRLPGTERLGQDDHPAYVARAGHPERRPRHRGRAVLPGPGQPVRHGWSRARGDQLPPCSASPDPSAHGGPGRRPRRSPGRRGAGPGRPDRRRPAQSRQFLHGHASAAGTGQRPDRGSGRPHSRRALERPGPSGHRVAARFHALPGRRRAHHLGVVAPAGGDGSDDRQRRDRVARAAQGAGNAGVGWRRPACTPAPPRRTGSAPS
jgi:hypothetical protein